MSCLIHLSSNKKGEINKFLSKFYNTSFNIENDLEWEKKYQNPIEIAEIVGTFIDNSDDYEIYLWISLDKDIFIYITENNADSVIRYLYERYPY